MKIAYLGPDSSFTSQVASQVFKKEKRVALSSIFSCLELVNSGHVDYAVVPIENTIEGTVNPTLDYLYHRGKAPVQQEVILPINQQLMVHPSWDGDLMQLKEVRSHPQALAQSQYFIHKYLPNVTQVSMDSTSQAAEWVKEQGEKSSVAAIGSQDTAKFYGLTMLKENIQDIAHNETRFWIIGQKELRLPSPSIQEKRSIGIAIASNQPGNLHRLLAPFSWRHIDLTKIESRPLKTKLGEYFFLMDIDNQQPDLVDMALSEINLLGGEIKEFGCYGVTSLA